MGFTDEWGSTDAVCVPIKDGAAVMVASATVDVVCRGCNKVTTVTVPKSMEEIPPCCEGARRSVRMNIKTPAWGTEQAEFGVDGRLLLGPVGEEE